MKSFHNFRPSLAVHVVVLLAASQPLAQAATVWTDTWNLGYSVPDNDQVGLTDTRTVSLPAGQLVTGVSVGLNLTGGWNGDLYAYLAKGDGFAVLLNRPGRDAVNPEGSDTSGMTVTFADDTFADLHTAISLMQGAVTGSYQPDGRAVSPATVLDTDLRTALLADFNGMDPSGDWTLFIADLNSGEQTTVSSWTLSLSTTAIPEPSSVWLPVLGVSSMLLRRRRRA
jgi:subtilisin-like proprotein convertase family protein